MCTLAVLAGVWKDAPLVVAANRDEMLDRRSTGPGRWSREAFMAPRDEVAGGTWLGLHRSGMFVGITNRAGAPRDAALESRGSLVVEALRLGSASQVHQALADGALDARRYNPFHLLYADAAGGAFVTWFDGQAVHQEALPRGLAVITERSLGGDDHGRTDRLRRHLQPLLALPSAPALEQLAPTMREHDDADPLASTCVHVPGLRYGTRSSLLLRVDDNPLRSRWLWTEGPPCEVHYVEVPIDLG